MSRDDAGVLRFLRSELRLVFTRRRNVVLLVILALVPILISVAVRFSSGPGGSGGAIFGAITQNGLFAALAALLVSGPLFLPLVIAVVAGDSVAGEANSGTLRYLLIVPVGRARLLAVKLTAIVVWCLSCVAAVAIAGVLSGLVLFQNNGVTLLSGRTVSYGDGLARLVLAALYVTLTVAFVGVLGLFVSTLTEVPLAAMATTLVITIVSEVADAVPQLASIHRLLPTHYWMRWIDLLRDPVPTHGMVTGLLVTLAYALVLAALAWARFGGKDITA